MGDAYADQLVRSGHQDQPEYPGLRTLRYPVLWEYIAPNSPGAPGWQWPEELLACL
jgi:dTDP-4-dehydrorhamnose reductase